jgi:hypothetical protein
VHLDGVIKGYYAPEQAEGWQRDGERVHPVPAAVPTQAASLASMRLIEMFTGSASHHHLAITHRCQCRCGIQRGGLHAQRAARVPPERMFRLIEGERLGVVTMIFGGEPLLHQIYDTSSTWTTTSRAHIFAMACC